MARGRPSKRQLILDTARALFAERGYQGTSIDLVVKQAEVSKPTVYNNFKTKQALLFALMEELTSESEAFCENLWQQRDLAPADAIIAAFENIANTPALLAVYRICYGESHKLEEETYQQFKQFDISLVESYRQHLATLKLDVSDSGFITIIAICREGILIPALSGAPQHDKLIIKQIVELQLKDNYFLAQSNAITK